MLKWHFWRRNHTLAASPAVVFWQWFTANEARLFAHEKHQATIFAELSRELHKVDRYLTFAFSGECRGKREFVVSGEGIREAFPVVIELVKAAPSLPRWDIVAFRPRTGASTITYNGVALACDEVSFVAVTRGAKVDLRLFLPTRVFDERRTHLALGFLMLDNLLGEHDVATKVGAIEVCETATVGAAQPRPIGDLPALVDGLGSSGTAD
jgi:hypothetical protein